MSLLPSIMHRLESLLVAIQLKHRLSASFPEGAKVGASRVRLIIYLVLFQLILIKINLKQTQLVLSMPSNGSGCVSSSHD